MRTLLRHCNTERFLVAALSFTIIFATLVPSVSAAEKDKLLFQLLLEKLDEELSYIQGKEPGTKFQNINFRIDSVILDLIVVQQTETKSGSNIGFIIPFIGKTGVELDTTLSQSNSRKLRISFIATDNFEVSEDENYQELGLYSAINTFKEAIRSALSTTPYLSPDEVMFTVNFNVIRDTEFGFKFVFLSIGSANKSKLEHSLTVKMKVARKQIN